MGLLLLGMCVKCGPCSLIRLRVCWVAVAPGVMWSVVGLWVFCVFMCLGFRWCGLLGCFVWWVALVWWVGVVVFFVMDDELMVRRLDLLEAQIVRVQSDVSRVLVELGVLAGELRALGVLPYEPRVGTLGAVNPTVKDLWC